MLGFIRAENLGLVNKWRHTVQQEQQQHTRYESTCQASFNWSCQIPYTHAFFAMRCILEVLTYLGVTNQYYICTAIRKIHVAMESVNKSLKHEIIYKKRKQHVTSFIDEPQRRPDRMTTILTLPYIITSNPSAAVM